MKILNLSFVAASVFLSLTTYAVDLVQIEKDLNGSGVEGWIHGSVSEHGTYVFTYRTPGNFFDYIEMSLIPSTPPIEAQLAGFGRHDKVLVKGHFMDNPSPQKHISIASLALVEKYKSDYPLEPYQHQAKIPDELRNVSNAVFLVHAVGGEGQILVAEYKDAIIPIYVKNGALTKNLFRNDVVKLFFKIRDNPNRPNEPTHLNLDESNSSAVTVLDSIQGLNGKPAIVEGVLVMFPKSPEIKFNVFAVQQELQAGLKRQFTLVNFDDPQVFGQIRSTLQNAWDRHPRDYVNGRNKLLSNKITVRVTGVFNEIDPSQANPQILIKSVSDIQVIEK